MRLKELELQGYKTFASRTTFALDGRITAIVGPNGSGKSNIADAMRWVLGEQSYRSLRGKRTEDMIFSGSAQRARLGMAAVSLVFDNAESWLPIDFSEVTLGRRAYRSGENEYLINGRRVRLGDISDLLSKSGLAQRTYAVIGQGLVDAVLSLRPEDRRALFEEAAGIAGYRLKRSEALARLEEARTNLVRVNDILNEIAPRLQRLAREAERARLHGAQTQQLDGLLRTAYGFRWHQVQLDLHRVRDAVARREARVERQRGEFQELLGRIGGLRDRQTGLREQLGRWHRESSELHRQAEEVQRGLAVRQERARLLTAQRDELEAELAALEVRARELEGRADAAREAVAASQEAVRRSEELEAAAKSRLLEHEGLRARLSLELADAQSLVLGLSTQETERSSRLEQNSEQRQALVRQQEQHQSALASLLAEASQGRVRLQAAKVLHSALLAEIDALGGEASSCATELAALQAEQGEYLSSLSAAELEVKRLEGRQELLARVRESGEGWAAGVREVKRASVQTEGRDGRDSQRSPGLTGIVGTVAELVHVPAAFELALEVALGAHLQDLVIETWQDAEAAIRFLREGSRGRATFLPLDTVRSGQRVVVPRDPGIVGLAAELVRAEARLSPVVEMLLGRTVVVHDLPAARRVFGRLQGGFQVVTLTGELLRSSGAVTGGHGQGQDRARLLAREREWRELPASLEAARAAHLGCKAALVESRQSEARLRTKSDLLAAKAKERRSAAMQQDAELRRLERDLDRAEQQVEWKQQLAEEAARQSEVLAENSAALHRELRRLGAERHTAEERASEVQEKLTALRGESLYQSQAEARTAAAVARRSAEHRRATLEGLQEQQSELAAREEARRRRLTGLGEEHRSLIQEIEAQTSQETIVQGWLLALTAKIEPAEAEVARLEAEHERLGSEDGIARQRLREAEAGLAQAQLARSRHEDRRQRLRRLIMDDFGLVDMEPMEDQPDQPPLPLAELVSTLPVVETMPEGLEEDIQQLRAQIRRLGAVHPAALEEYAEVSGRHSFLTSQAADLEEASRHLRDVVAELDSLMHQEFEKTFGQVSGRFQENFSRLFGGGTARLTLTEPAELATTGVEIMARPPGKRQQTLAMLSGGERSLTAVALVFAFLQTNPPPFSILDEVDAMLDEANVLRFGQMLQALSERIQFVVITHNRTTLQAADTIYGVSMADDNTSQVVSLKLEGDRIVSPTGGTVHLGVG